MYYVPLIMLSLFSVWEIWKGDKKRLLFLFSFGLLVLMLCLRYGQGTDYFGYMINYDTVDKHSEVGFLFVSRLFKMFGIPFEIFIGSISIFQMLCLYRALVLYSPIKTLSLLVFYPTLYLTYCFSGLRQGIVIVFFLGFMIKWLEENKWVRYLFACMIMATIHSAALVLIPLVFYKYIRLSWLYIGIVIAACMGLVIYLVPGEWFSFIHIGSVEYYINTISISAMGLAERVVMFALISFLVLKIPKDESHVQIWFLYKIYTCGFIISILFFPWAMLSSRLGAMMKATEIFLIPILIKENVKMRKVIVAFVLSYVLLMTTKNLMSYISEGEYVGYNVITYPYLSVFDQDRAHEIRYKEWNGYLNLLQRYKKAHNIP